MAQDTTNDGGPAFPQLNQCSRISRGMTLRDYFAAHALAGLMAGDRLALPDTQEEIAAECYELADAMLAEREKK